MSGATTFGAAARHDALQLRPYTVAQLPPASKFSSCVVSVTNGAAGSATLAFSDGVNWKRVDNLATVSAS